VSKQPLQDIRPANESARVLSEAVASNTATVTVRGIVAAMKFLSDIIMSPLDQLHPRQLEPYFKGPGCMRY